MHRLCSNFRCEENYHETKLPLGTTTCPKCRKETDVEFDPGDVINISQDKQARIIEKLSRHTDAGMSSVYLAERTNSRRARAVVKVAKQSKKAAVRVLEREVTHLKNLKHPNIIRLAEGKQGVWRDHKDGQELVFTALEYLPGGSLKDRLAGKKPLSLEDAVKIVIATSQALDYVHQQGLVHLDVKPANIMFDDHGRVVLSDFGVSRTQPEVEKIRGRLGTLNYNAPEMLKRGTKVDKRVDIYALGVTFYEMLLGECPVQISKSEVSSGDESILRRLEKLPPSTRRLPNLSPDIHPIIAKATHPDRSRRYNRAGVMARDLAEALKKVPNSHSSHGLVMILAGLAVALVVVGTVVGLLLLDDNAASAPDTVVTIQDIPEPGEGDAFVGLGEVDTTPTAIKNAPLLADDDVAPAPGPSPTVTLKANQSARPTATLAVFATSTTASSAKTPVRTTLSPAKQPTADGQLALVSPGNNFNISSDTVEFKWQYSGQTDCVELPDNQFFELRLWPDIPGKTPQGAMNAIADSSQVRCGQGVWSFTIGNIRHTRGVLDADRVDRFFWDVALVKVEPAYKPMAHSEARVINIPVE